MTALEVFEKQHNRLYTVNDWAAIGKHKTPELYTDLDLAIIDHFDGPKHAEKARAARDAALQVAGSVQVAVPATNAAPSVAKAAVVQPSARPAVPGETPEDFLKRIGVPSVDIAGVTYDTALFREASRRYYLDPRSMTLDDIKQFTVVDAGLGSLARAKQFGYVDDNFTEAELEALKQKVSHAEFIKWRHAWLVPTLATYRYRVNEADRRAKAAEQGLEGATQRIDALTTRVAELESRPHIKHGGVWKVGKRYTRDDAVTHHGSLWFCKTDTAVGEPGYDFASWQLAVKRGTVQ